MDASCPFALSAGGVKVESARLFYCFNKQKKDSGSKTTL